MIESRIRREDLRVALVHDWLNQAGGAEHVLDVLHDMFPAAQVFTTIHDAARVPVSERWDVRTNWMDRLPGVHAHHQPYLPLYPVAWDTAPLPRGKFDLVLSNKSGFCHGVRTGGATHVCYCLTPTRYVWDPQHYLENERVPAAGRLALSTILPWLKRWDLKAAGRVDHFIAISTAVQRRIKDVYHRDSTVIHPPTDVEAFRAAAAHRMKSDDEHPTSEAYDLIVARLVPYKRIDLAVQAFTRIGRRLVIAGDGRDRERLERLAGPNVSFLGRVPQDELVRLVAGCRSLIWPGVEDFGLVPVEAMAAGRPVVAIRSGGVIDTIEEGVNGVFFDSPSLEALEAALHRADSITWDRDLIQARSERFSRDVFERKLLSFISNVVPMRETE